MQIFFGTGLEFAIPNCAVDLITECDRTVDTVCLWNPNHMCNIINRYVFVLYIREVFLDINLNVNIVPFTHWLINKRAKWTYCTKQYFITIEAVCKGKEWTVNWLQSCDTCKKAQESRIRKETSLYYHILWYGNGKSIWGMVGICLIKHHFCSWFY